MSARPADPLITVGGKRPKKRMTAAQRKKRRKTQKMIVGGVLALLALFIWYGFQPLTATNEYGVCRTLAELNAQNHNTMKIISYENYGAAWKIFYTFTGQYGEQRSNYIDCVFTRNAQGQMILKEAKINRQELSEEALARFNQTIPAILAAGPNLVVPPPLEETDLTGLKTIIDTGVED